MASLICQTAFRTFSSGLSIKTVGPFLLADAKGSLSHVQTNSDGSNACTGKNARPSIADDEEKSGSDGERCDGCRYRGTELRETDCIHDGQQEDDATNRQLTIFDVQAMPRATLVY